MTITELERTELERYASYYDYAAFMSGKVFLITGAKGIVGSGIIKWLLFMNLKYDLGLKIVATTRNPEDVPDFVTADDPIRYIRYGDEERNTQGEQVDYIIHAASSTDNKFHMSHPFESFRINFDGTERLIELALKKENASFIYISSEEVYGITDSTEPIAEDEPTSGIGSMNPRNCYPISKLASEFITIAANTEYGLKTHVIRPTGIQGLYQSYDAPRVANEILRCAVEHRDLELNSDGTSSKCIMYSLDAIAAIFTVLFKGEEGGVYNASDPNNFLSVNELAEKVFTRFSPENVVIHKIGKDITKAGFLPHRSIVQDISRIKPLGWKPLTDLEQIYAIDIERFTSK